MKRFLLLLLLAFIVFVVVFRQRVFMWDPIASVTRDGVKQSGVRVMINYSNDVLLDDKSTNTRRLYVVQNWDQTPKFSTGLLKCVQFLACMTEADQAPGEKISPRLRTGAPVPVSMSNKQVQFADENGSHVIVSLR